MINEDLTIEQRITELIQSEIEDYDVSGPQQANTLQSFRAVLQRPRRVGVNFSGGIRQACWSVTRSDGDYRVVFLPLAGYFSLCVESDFGPLDIGVHGTAIGCFGSV